MRFSCKCAQSLCVDVLTLEPPAEAAVGISEWFIAPAFSKSCSLGSLACLAAPQCCLLGCLAPGASLPGSSSFWCNRVEHLEQDLCYLQAHAVQ